MTQQFQRVNGKGHMNISGNKVKYFLSDDLITNILLLSHLNTICR